MNKKLAGSHCVHILAVEAWLPCVNKFVGLDHASGCVITEDFCMMTITSVYTLLV